ncbi:BspA family leucine-rich repeat surface protein [Fructobacillus sp. M2-14]|uniref:BspA family leucine-rich repeat surface protein n=1 Tax=Fructobacillus broussonetiae TaxID=2713173 RepID=A0ABS5R0X9_9LACO|nr:BspA family leucine-rich repeat surface protein [Fructobacillus broussonetiae]MBS9339099.1 BspA family leucine-rich repeat surface protein [Fructobacillus broussonetiae]
MKKATFGSSFNTKNVKNMNVIFQDAKTLESVDLSMFNTSNVTEMQEMFAGTESLTNLDLSSFDMSNVKKLGAMFQATGDANGFTLSLPTNQISPAEFIRIAGGWGTSVQKIDFDHGGTREYPKGNIYSLSDLPASMQFEAGTYYFSNGNIQEQHKNVTRTVRYLGTDGQLIPGTEEKQETLSFTRKARFNQKGEFVSADAWKPSIAGKTAFSSFALPNNLNDNYENPKHNGESISSVAAETPELTNDTENQNVNYDVVYESKADADKSKSDDNRGATNKVVSLPNTSGALTGNTQVTVNSRMQKYHDQGTVALPTTGKKVNAFASVALPLAALTSSSIFFFFTKRKK